MTRDLEALLRVAVLWIAIAGAEGCRGDPESPYNVAVGVSGEGDGSGVVEFEHPVYGTQRCVPRSPLADETCFEFQDAGGGGSLSLLAVPDVGSVFGAWIGCATVTGAECGLTFEDTPAAVWARVRFDLDAVCQTPPDVINTSHPPFPPALAAGLGANLIVDPGFEQGVRVGDLPTGFSYWRGDRSASVTAQQAVVPRTGGERMLHFIATAPTLPPPNRVTSEQVQLIDVSALREVIDSESLIASGRAYFTRVSGCPATDTGFGMQLIAYDGGPEDVQERWSFGIAEAGRLGVTRESLENIPGSWLRYRAGAIPSHDAPGSWQAVDVSLQVPAGTTVIQVVIYAAENRSDDAAFPEFHGHYADDVSVVLSRP